MGLQTTGWKYACFRLSQVGDTHFSLASEVLLSIWHTLIDVCLKGEKYAPVQFVSNR